MYRHVFKLLTKLLPTIAFIALSGLSFAQSVNLAEPIDLASRDIVPDQKTAIAIGVAVLVPIYGAALINKEMPFSAKRQGGKWIVEGSLPKNTIGGVATVELSARDGRVMYIYHSQ